MKGIVTFLRLRTPFESQNRPNPAPFVGAGAHWRVVALGWGQRAPGSAMRLHRQKPRRFHSRCLVMIQKKAMILVWDVKGGVTHVDTDHWYQVVAHLAGVFFRTARGL